MERGLVLTESTQNSQRIIKLAGEIAHGMDGTIVVLRVIDETDYVDNVQEKAKSRSEAESLDEVIEQEVQILEDQYSDMLDRQGVDHEFKAIVGSIPKDVLRTASENDIDHLFISGQSRSPAGKAIFGDNAQRLLLNFDGPVTSLISH